MTVKSIWERIKSRKIILYNIEAKKIDKNFDQDSSDISLETIVEIVNSDSETLSIKADTKVSFIPESLFSINIGHFVEYKLINKLDDKEIEDNINELMAPIAVEVSYLISFLTQKMIGTHIILPPKLNIKIK
ncbi:MAG: hypothetical protein GX069_01730 [Tissierellia bacterium]|nr:hypothetical protein [Tissierellia bacterium]